MTIQREQLDIQLDRLSEAFGEKNFGEQRSRMVWIAVEGMEYQDVISICDKFIREFKHAPLPKDFLEAAREYNRNATTWALGEIRPREIAKCFDCGDSGFVRVQRRATYDKWAVYSMGSMPCHCDRGRELIEKGKRRAKGAIDLGAQYGDYHAKSYAKIPAHSASEPSFSLRPNGKEPA